MAKSYEAASNCHHLGGDYDKAAEALHLGNLYDQLIIYLTEYQSCRYLVAENLLTLFSRNLERVALDKRQKYSKLSNLLMKQGRISMNLNSICIDLLGSEIEKEQFYRDFEMTQELTTLYIEQKRDREIYYLLIEDGDLERALELASTGNLIESIPNDEILQAYNFIQAEKLQHSADDEFDPYSRLVQYGPCSATLSTTAAQWEAAASVFATAQSGGMETESLTGVNNNAIRECVCFLVSWIRPAFDFCQLTE